jgi:pimeloyl-ACP methyl ester carboxylesterase
MITTQPRTNNIWHTYNDADTAFVFIHGIFSDSQSCWRSDNSRDQRSVFWPDLIRSDRRLGEPSIYLAGYYTALDAGDFPVAQCAREVFDALRRPGVDGKLAPFERGQLVFICHSTGGIVARYMLEKYRDTFAEKAVGLVLIASPSLGSGWANLASFAARYYNQRLGLQLRWDNAELEDIHWRFQDLVAHKDALMPGLFGMEAAEHAMIYRDRIPVWIRWMLPPRLKVVATLSAGQYFGSVKILPGTNHFTAVKPDSVNHPSHEFLVDFMIGFRAASDKLFSLPAAIEPAGKAVGETSSTHRYPYLAETWPSEAGIELPYHYFFAEAGFESTSRIAVVTCITVEDLKRFETRFEAGIMDIMNDPYFLAVPTIMEALRARKLSYKNVDPELRSRIVELSADLIFEAYVYFGKLESESAVESVFTSASTGLLFQRLRAGGSRPMTLSLAPAAQNREQTISNTLKNSLNRIKAVDRQDIMISLRAGKMNEAGCVIAEYVSAIVLERLRSPDSVGARAFERIHPTKVRLIHDLDTGEFFSRKRPFKG